jgi:hypothetical protein
MPIVPFIDPSTNLEELLDLAFSATNLRLEGTQLEMEPDSTEALQATRMILETLRSASFSCPVPVPVAQTYAELVYMSEAFHSGYRRGDLPSRQVRDFWDSLREFVIDHFF